MANKIRTLGAGTLTIGETGSSKDFSADVINTALEVSTDTADTDYFLDGHSEGGAQTDSYTLTGTVKDDFSMEGVQVWCMQHSGETMPFTWVPNTKGTLQFSGKVVIAPIQFGGDVKSKNENDFSFVCLDPTPAAYSTGSSE